MTTLLTKLAAGSFLLLLCVGIAGRFSANQNLPENEKTSPSDAEVTVTIAIPEGITLTGTAIITLEDISLQDAPSTTLARINTEASTLMLGQPNVVIPIDLNLVDPNADLNVAVHIDTDNDGLMSDEDWISDTIVNVINNDKMAVVVDIIQI